MITKIFFLGGKQAGCVGLLTLLAAGCKISGLVAYDSTVEKLAKAFVLPTFPSIYNSEVSEILSRCDLLVSVHGREIVPTRLLELPRLGGVNAHPCLYAYKGSTPVNRLLRDGNTLASVGVHRMTDMVDEGEVLAEEFVDVADAQSVEAVYNALYPYYSLALLKSIQTLEN